MFNGYLAMSAIIRASPSAFAASAPWIEVPARTVASGHSFLINLSEDPIPLPSLVQKGIILLPEKS